MYWFFVQHVSLLNVMKIDWKLTWQEKKEEWCYWIEEHDINNIIIYHLMVLFKFSELCLSNKELVSTYYFLFISFLFLLYAAFFSQQSIITHILLHFLKSEILSYIPFFVCMHILLLFFYFIYTIINRNKSIISQNLFFL